MRTTRTVIVEKEVTTYKCDFCYKSTENNSGICGVRPIMQCCFCKKDCCDDHREWYSEDNHSDYPRGVWACQDCKPIADRAWEEAEDRIFYIYDDIIEIMRKCFEEIKNEKI